jgi:hypothetical protein
MRPYYGCNVCSMLLAHPVEVLHPLCPVCSDVALMWLHAAFFLAMKPLRSMQDLCDPASASCCSSDISIQDTWCRTVDTNHKLYSNLCEPWSDRFGMHLPQFTIQGGELLYVNGSEWIGDVGTSPFCDVLGARQRQWLSNNLRHSDALLNIVVAPGSLLGDPASLTSAARRCGRYPWDCHQPAQVNLLHTLANATGCTLLLAGVLDWLDCTSSTSDPLCCLLA